MKGEKSGGSAGVGIASEMLPPLEESLKRDYRMGLRVLLLLLIDSLKFAEFIGTQVTVGIGVEFTK